MARTNNVKRNKDSAGSGVSQTTASPKRRSSLKREPLVQTRQSGHGPAYQRVAVYVQNLIRNGKLVPGSALPSERALAGEFGVCHLTVRKGLALLVEQGLIERQVGQGTFVADKKKSASSAAGMAGSGATGGASKTGNAIALCVVETKAEAPVMGYAINGVRRALGSGARPLEIIDYPKDGCTDQLWNLLGDRVEGIIVQGYLSASDIQTLREREMKFVSVGLQIGSEDAPWVSFDFHDMLTRMVQEAYRFGHRSIGMVKWDFQEKQRAPDHASPPMHEAYRQACRQFNMNESADRIYKLPIVPWPDSSLVDTRPVMDDLKNLPSVLIVTDEVMAGALLRDFEARGVRVPDDLSMICLLDSTPNTHRLPMSGVDARAEYMAIYETAAKLLKATLDGDTTANMRVLHQCKVHFKASLASAK